MSNYNPKTVVHKELYGDPFDTLQEGIDWLLSEAKKEGYSAQVIGQVSISGVTRFAVSQVTQHTDYNNLSFRLKLADGKKVADAETTLVGEEGYQKLFENVESNLKRTPEVDFYQGLPDAQSGDPVDLSGSEWLVEDRADAVIEAVQTAEEIDDSVIVAGTATSSTSYTHIVSTEGVDVETSSSGNYFKVNSILGPPESRGYGQEEVYWRYDRPDVVGMAKEATQTAKDTLELETIEPDEYEVLLGPQAVSDLLLFLLFSTDAVSFHESDSYASDKLGDKIFDEKLTIRDLPRDPKLATSVRSFDAEGIPTENRTFIDEGVLKFVPYSSFFAAKYLDDKNMVTGHALQNNNAIPVSGVVEPGQKTLEEQMEEVEDGLYVKNFWYNRFTKKNEGGLTGLTRNGLYRVKNGEIQGAVRNLRYTESFVNAFSQDNIISIGSDQNKFQLVNTPPMHLDKYTFTSVAHVDKSYGSS